MSHRATFLDGPPHGQACDIKQRVGSIFLDEWSSAGFLERGEGDPPRFARCEYRLSGEIAGVPLYSLHSSWMEER